MANEWITHTASSLDLSHNVSVITLTSQPLLTLLIRSSRVSAIMPFFMLWSAFVTLKGLSRGVRPDRSCWVMEALAVTHLRRAIRCVIIILNNAIISNSWSSALTWRGKTESEG